MGLTVNASSKIEYKVTTKPFFGSLKNAEKALLKASRYTISHDEFLTVLEKSYSTYLNDIEFVNFYDFAWTFNDRYTRNMNFKLAMIYTAPNAKLRDKLFAERDNITLHTGWYPYVVGSRANVISALHRAFKEENGIDSCKIEPFRLGKPLSIMDVSNNPAVNAVLLECLNGSILFDTGFGVNLPSECNLKAICISHFHSDHCGGLFELLKTHSVPVLITETTLDYLLVLPNISYEDKLNLCANAVVLEQLIYGRIFRNFLDFFPVFHCPGSTGFVYKGFPGHSIYYLGDVCLKNGFFNFRTTVDRMIAEDKNDKKHIIIDAALIGKSNFTIDSDDIPVVLLQDVGEMAGKRNVIFISNSVETLLYSYILFFIKSNTKVRNSIKLSTNNDLYNVIRSLWGPVILSQKGSAIDPFVKNVLQGGRCNFAETQRLYPLSSLDSIDDWEKTASFVTMSDVDTNIQIQSRIKSSDVILLGHWTMKASIPESIAKLHPRSVLRVSSPEWSFHTSEGDIAEAISAWEKFGVEIILFHNYSKVLRKFSKSLPNTNYIQNCIEM